MTPLLPRPSSVLRKFYNKLPTQVTIRKSGSNRHLVGIVASFRMKRKAGSVVRGKVAFVKIFLRFKKEATVSLALSASHHFHLSAFSVLFFLFCFVFFRLRCAFAPFAHRTSAGTLEIDAAFLVNYSASARHAPSGQQFDYLQRPCLRGPEGFQRSPGVCLDRAFSRSRAILAAHRFHLAGER